MGLAEAEIAERVALARALAVAAGQGPQQVEGGDDGLECWVVDLHAGEVDAGLAARLDIGIDRGGQPVLQGAVALIGEEPEDQHAHGERAEEGEAGDEGTPPGPHLGIGGDEPGLRKHHVLQQALRK